MEALHIDAYQIIFAVINFLILVGVLTKFLYIPYLAILEDRKRSIQDSFDHATDTNKLADRKLDEYNKRIANVEAESREIIKNAKIRAEAQANDIIEEANATAARIKEKAELEVERQQAKAMSEMKAQIAELALLAAERILERELTVSGQDQLIDGIIEEVGATKWQN